MKSESVSQYVTLAANVGVLLGIILLAYELNQNNDLLETQIFFNQQQSRMIAGSTARDEPLAKAVANARNGQSLSGAEQVMLSDWYYESFIIWQWEYREYKRGRYTPNTQTWKEILTAQSTNGVKRYPGMREEWDIVKRYFDADFTDFMEENVISQLE